MAFASAEAISVKSLPVLGAKLVKGAENWILNGHRVEKVEEEEQGERVWKRLSGGGSVCSFRALKQRDGEKGEKKKTSSHCAGVDVRATGCDRSGDSSLSHTRRHLEKQAIMQIKCQADKRESTGRVKTCGFIYGHKMDFLTPSAGGEKKPPPLLFFFR